MEKSRRILTAGQFDAAPKTISTAISHFGPNLGGHIFIEGEFVKLMPYHGEPQLFQGAQAEAIIAVVKGLY
jgi:hypothetical protein